MPGETRAGIQSREIVPINGKRLSLARKIRNAHSLPPLEGGICVSQTLILKESYKYNFLSNTKQKQNQASI